MKTELSHFNGQDLRDAPCWPPQNAIAVTAILPEADKLFHFPLDSVTYAIQPISSTNTEAHIYH